MTNFAYTSSIGIQQLPYATAPANFRVSITGPSSITPQLVPVGSLVVDPISGSAPINFNLTDPLPGSYTLTVDTLDAAGNVVTDPSGKAYLSPADTFVIAPPASVPTGPVAVSVSVSLLPAVIPPAAVAAPAAAPAVAASALPGKPAGV